MRSIAAALGLSAMVACAHAPGPGIPPIDDPEEDEPFGRESLTAELGPCEGGVAHAMAAFESGHEASARASLQQTLRDEPRCASAYRSLGALDRRAGQWQPAATNLRRALAIRADDAETLNELALVQLGWAGDEPARLDLAAIVCRQAQLVDPGFAPLYNTRALVAIARGDLSAASADLERARRLDPELFEAHMNFGQLTLSQRAYRDAAEAFRAARGLRPRSYDAAIGLGVALRGLERPEEAEGLYRAAIAIDDSRPEAYFDLAVLYQEHREGTVEQLRRAEAWLGAFVQRARRSGAHEETLRAVLHWCADGPGRCRPGRAQNIHEALVAYGQRDPGERPPWTRAGS